MMRARWSLLLLATAAGCTGTEVPTDAGSPSLAKPGAPAVRILDLGTLGGNQSHGYSLNTPAAGNELVVVGTSDGITEPYPAAYWRVNIATQHVDRGVLTSVSDATQSNAYDVNQSETIVGSSYFGNSDGTGAGWSAVRWTRTASGWTASLIPTLDAKSRHDATAINAFGYVAGSSPTVTGEEHIYLFDGTTTTDRGGLGGRAEAHEVTLDGIIVGTSHAASGPLEHAYISYPNLPPALLPDFGGRSAARAINVNGVIVGYATNAAGESRAVRWTRSAQTGEYGIEDLGLTRARVWDINDAGEMTGSFVGKSGERAFFRSATGTIKELPILSGSSIGYAINESAQIVGISQFRNGYSHAVLWTNVR